MKNKYIKILGIILSIGLLVLISILIYNHFKRGKEYTFDLPKYEDITNISITLGDTTVTNVHIDQIYDTLNIDNKITNIESISDYPVLGNDVLTIKVKSDKEFVFYAYKKKNKYYFEVPYNGIYEVKKEVYDNICKQIPMTY